MRALSPFAPALRTVLGLLLAGQPAWPGLIHEAIHAVESAHAHRHAHAAGGHDHAAAHPHESSGHEHDLPAAEWRPALRGTTVRIEPPSSDPSALFDAPTASAARPDPAFGSFSRSGAAWLPDPPWLAGPAPRAPPSTRARA